MVTRQQIVEGLRALGLPRGRPVLVHSSLSSFGEVRGGPEALLDALLEAVGPQGTVVVPTFATPGEVFDPAASPTPLGALCEALRRCPGAARSLSPLASVAALGAEAEALCAGHDRTRTAHAEGTPYLRIVERGGYVLLLGVDQDRSTMLHAAEELVRAAYLQPAAGKVRDGDAVREVSYLHFPGPHRDFIGLDRPLRERGIVKVGRIGPCVARLMEASALVDAVVEMLRKDPAAVLCDNPACEDCVLQRAALRRDRVAREAFVLAAQTRLAGRYPEEIADRLARCGVSAVEIDLVCGKDLLRLGAEGRRELRSHLQRRNIVVSSVRFAAVPDDVSAALDAVLEVGAPMVVVPWSASRGVLEAVRGAGFSVALENVAVRPKELGERLESLSDLDVQCAFNPAAFARAGVKPFLEAYKRPVRKHVGLLYLTDACRDGRAARLGRGNAELKEMVSILRCASFRGPMVLCGVEALERRAEEFFALLESL